MRTVYSSPLERDRRGRWLRLHYSQSFLEQPRRGLLCFLSQTGESSDHILPAATFGRARWLGAIPSDAVGLELAFPVESDRSIRIDAVQRLTSLRVALAILRRRPAGLPGFLLSLLSAHPRKRMLRALSALDFAPMADVRAFAEAHGRRVEPLDLDRDTGRALGSPEIEFVIAEDRGTDRRDLDATLNSLGHQSDRRFRVRLLRDDRLEAAEIGAQHNLPLVLVDRSYGGNASYAIGQPLLSTEAAWIAELKPGDVLTPEAVLCLRAFIQRTHDVDAVYTDSVVRSPNGRSAYPHAKPDWSPSFFSRHDYIGRLVIFRTEALRRMTVDARNRSGGLSADILRARHDPPLRIEHLRRFLVETEPDAGAAQAATPAAPIAPEPTKASIIIPTRDGLDLLRTAIESLRAHTPADLMEIVVVDNDGRDAECLAYLEALDRRPDARVVRHPGAFNFSAMINRGAVSASGDVLVLLNNDCAALHDGWLQALSGLAMQPEIGAVGAKLLYDDGTLQHAGVGIGLGGEAGHRNRGRDADLPGHLDRLKYVHEVSAVTGACLAVERRKFDAVGGFDEAFAVAFNDIDFCLRLGARGWRTLYTPHATLRHSESVSRGSDQHPSRRARWQAEAALFRERWMQTILEDPYMHPSLCLWRFDEMLH